MTLIELIFTDLFNLSSLPQLCNNIHCQQVIKVRNFNYNFYIMKLILIIFLTFSFGILSSQVVIKTKYSNIASQGFALGISKYSGNNNLILDFYSQKRYRIINTGIEISSTLKDYSVTLENMYISISAGLGIPIIHGKKSTTTFNIVGTYNVFDIGTDKGFQGKIGYETSLKYNIPFASFQVGYSGNPKSENPYLNRKGFFVKLGIGLNEFFSKEKGWEIENYTPEQDDIESKKK